MKQIKDIDFSMWHPLDHRVASKRCLSFYGGPLNHIKIQWAYVTKPKLYAKLMCPHGYHKETIAGQENETWISCWNCHEKLRTLSEADIDKYRKFLEQWME